MLSPSQLDLAARHLLAARRVGQPGPRVPESHRPTEVEDALAIQQRVQAALGVATGGWKCSVPTADRPVACAAIFAPAIARTSPCAVAGSGTAARIEPEIAFVLGRELPPRETPYTEAEVRAAIAETRLVLEILGSRYANPESVGFPELLADQISNAGLFVGPIVEDALDRPLGAFPIAVDGPTGSIHRRDGRHPDGHPLRPLIWLANHLAARGEIGGLKAGQIVTTGSYAGALEAPVAVPLAIVFDGLGQIAVELRPATEG